MISGKGEHFYPRWEDKWGARPLSPAREAPGSCDGHGTEVIYVHASCTAPFTVRRGFQRLYGASCDQDFRVASALSAPEGHSARQLEISDGVVLDLDARDGVLGIEFLTPNLPREELAELGVSDEILDMLDHVVHTPLPRREGGTVMPTSGHMRSDQTVEDVRIPA